MGTGTLPYPKPNYEVSRSSLEPQRYSVQDPPVCGHALPLTYPVTCCLAGPCFFRQRLGEGKLWHKTPTALWVRLGCQKAMGAHPDRNSCGKATQRKIWYSFIWWTLKRIKITTLTGGLTWSTLSRPAEWVWISRHPSVINQLLEIINTTEEKYRDLAIEIGRIWKKRTNTVPIVIGALGTISKNHLIYLGELDGWMNGVLGHFYALSRLNWAGDNLG